MTSTSATRDDKSAAAAAAAALTPCTQRRVAPLVLASTGLRRRRCRSARRRGRGSKNPNLIRWLRCEGAFKSMRWCLSVAEPSNGCVDLSRLQPRYDCHAVSVRDRNTVLCRPTCMAGNSFLVDCREQTHRCNRLRDLMEECQPLGHAAKNGVAPRTCVS